MWDFRSLQMSLLLCSFVAVVGGAFFLATALFIEKDRHLAENYVPSDDAPIIVPKRGRSTKVSVSSVLIWDGARIWMVLTQGTALWLAQADRASPGAVITDWTISTIRSFIVIYYAHVFVYILNTLMIWEHFGLKNINNILPGSPVCLVHPAFPPDESCGRRQRHTGNTWEKKMERGYMVGIFRYLLLKLLKMCFRIHVNYIYDVFIGGDLSL